MDASDWDERYATKELIWSAEPNRFLPPAIDGMTPGRALDLACGEGRNAIWLARNGWEVTGVDFSSAGIEKAKKLAGDTEVTWEVADVTTYEPKGEFDLVIVFYVHFLAAEMDQLLEVATKALAPGGRLFGVGHAVRNASEGHGGPPYPQVLWDAEEMAPRLEGLDVAENGERLRDVDGADRPAIDLVIDATRR